MSNSTDDDDKLFAQAMQDVKKLSSNRVTHTRKPGPIKKREKLSVSSIKDTLSDDFIPPCDDFLEFIRPGIQKSYLKQIRNGKIPTEDDIDLHGYRRDDARRALLEFIHHAQQQNYRLVRVVHGKGYNSSDNTPVLKAMVNKWLQNIPQVLAFVSAIPRDGGIGAVYVLLKKMQDNQADLL